MNTFQAAKRFVWVHLDEDVGKCDGTLRYTELFLQLYRDWKVDQMLSLFSANLVHCDCELLFRDKIRSRKEMVQMLNECLALREDQGISP